MAKIKRLGYSKFAFLRSTEISNIQGWKRPTHNESIFDIMELTDFLLKFQSCGFINYIIHHYWLSAKKEFLKLTEALHKSSNRVDPKKPLRKSQKMYFKILFFQIQVISEIKQLCFTLVSVYFFFPLFITQWQFPVIPFFKFCDNPIAHATSSDSLKSLYDESMGVKNWSGQ